MICAKFGWNWPSCYREEDFKISLVYFLLFCNYLPFEKGVALHLNNLEFPSPKDALCQVWLKFAQFWRRWNRGKVTDRWTDDRRSEKPTWAFSSGELKMLKVYDSNNYHNGHQTNCDQKRSQAFGNLVVDSTNSPCHCIKWKLFCLKNNGFWQFNKGINGNNVTQARIHCKLFRFQLRHLSYDCFMLFAIWTSKHNM